MNASEENNGATGAQGDASIANLQSERLFPLSRQVLTPSLPGYLCLRRKRQWNAVFLVGHRVDLFYPVTRKREGASS